MFRVMGFSSSRPLSKNKPGSQRFGQSNRFRHKPILVCCTKRYATVTLTETNRIDYSRFIKTDRLRNSPFRHHLGTRTHVGFILSEEGLLFARVNPSVSTRGFLPPPPDQLSIQNFLCATSILIVLLPRK